MILLQLNQVLVVLLILTLRLPGYMRNKLFPEGYAIYATKNNVENHMKNLSVREIKKKKKKRKKEKKF